MGAGGWAGGRRLPGREEIIAAGLCLAVTLTGSDCVGLLGGRSLREQKAGQGTEFGPSRPHHQRPPCWPCAWPEPTASIASTTGTTGSQDTAHPLRAFLPSFLGIGVPFTGGGGN